MFKPHYGNCSNQDCGRTGVLIPVRSGLCDKCNYERKQSNKKPRINGVSREEQVDCDSYKRESCREVYQTKKSPSFKNRKKIQSSKKGTGQAEIFEEIAAEREWVCFVTGTRLFQLTATQFAHVLPKALNKYPLFKLYKPNIQLVTNEAHYLWDHTPRSELRKDKRFDKLFELEEQLKEEYKLLKS